MKPHHNKATLRQLIESHTELIENVFYLFPRNINVWIINIYYSNGNRTCETSILFPWNLKHIAYETSQQSNLSTKFMEPHTKSLEHAFYFHIKLIHKPQNINIVSWKPNNETVKP